MIGEMPAHKDASLNGIYHAIVTQNKDEQQLARVRVRFPWLPGGDQDQSHWALLSVPMMGAEFGTFTLPEVNDTVLVMFLAGDIRRPVVIGGAWSKEDAPPECNENGKNDFRFIKSRSGHRLLFDDSDKTKVVVTDKTNENYIGCGTYAEGGESPNKFALTGPGPINGDAKEGVAVSSMQGTVNLWCPNGTLKISAKHVEMTASDKMEVKAGGALGVEGGMCGEMKSSGAGKYAGSTTKVG